MSDSTEFFLFLRGADGRATSVTHDVGGYFDLAPVDRGEEARRDIVGNLEGMGFQVEAAHHEVAPGQHEIDFKLADAVTASDNYFCCPVAASAASTRSAKGPSVARVASSTILGIRRVLPAKRFFLGSAV